MVRHAGQAALLTTIAASLFLPVLCNNVTFLNSQLEHLAKDGQIQELVKSVVYSVTQPKNLQTLVRNAANRNGDFGTSSAVCEMDLQRWLSALLAGELWAIKMVDASSKLITGVLYGNLGDLGNFDECVTATAGSLDDPKELSGRYSLPAIDVQMLQNTTLREGEEDKPVQGRWKTAITLRFAICAPKSCRARQVESILEYVIDFVNGFLESRQIRLEVRLPEKFTSTNDGWRQPNRADWAVLALCLFVLMMVAIGTAIDLMTEKSKSGMRRQAGILLAFSAYTNGRRLFTVAPPGEDNFTAINGIRFLSAVWVIMGHRYRFMVDVPFTNLATMPDIIKNDLSKMLIGSAPLSVDTFFVMGGLVNAYVFLKFVKRRNSFNIFQYYIHRYIRLTPALAIMVAITATWLDLLGNGPMWHMEPGVAGEDCRQYWWSTLIYIANYYNPTHQCMMQSWYLMVDMQLHWLSPLALIPLWKFGRLGVGWLILLIIGSCALPFYISYIYEFRAPIPMDFDVDKQGVTMTHLYYPTHMRFTSYLVGILAGYLLYKSRTGRLRIRLTKVQVILGWLLSAFLCLMALFTAHPLFDTVSYEYNRFWSSFYIAFYRVFWAMGISWVVLACANGRGGPINAFLSCPPFMVLGRLTYGMYLTHAAFQLVDMGTIRTSDYFSDYKMLQRTLGDMVLAIGAGILLSLTMESPVMAIEKALRGGGGRGNRQQSPSQGQPSGRDNQGFTAENISQNVPTITVSQDTVDYVKRSEQSTDL